MPPAEATDHVARIQEQFSRQAEAYKRLKIVTDPRMIAAVVSASGVRPGDRIVDLACGPGFLTMGFAERAAEAVGVDVTDTFLDGARAEAAARGLRNVSFIHGDVTRLQFPDSVFDVSVCRSAFHHFPQPAAVLAEMTRVTRGGGMIVIVDMLGCEDPAKSAYHDRVEKLCDPTHARAIPASEFEQMFAAHGLRIVSKANRETSYSLPEWIAHGGPSESVAGEIRRLMEASIATDLCGLRVRREADGELHFSHQGAGYFLTKPA